MYDWQTLRQWYPYSSLKLLSMFMTRQLPLVALAALVFLVLRPGAAHSQLPCQYGGANCGTQYPVWRGESPIRPLLPLVVVCSYFMLVHMITWSEMRYSEPLHPLLAIIVVAAGKEGVDCITRKQPS